MEDRLRRGQAPIPGAALIALASILAITLAWWALALWPAGAIEPEWLARTRAACFGSSRGGLPDAGGWILLVGEPLGMLALLVVLFHRSLRCDLRALLRHHILRAAAVGTATVTLALTGILLLRVTRTLSAPVDASAGAAIPRAVDRMAPDIALQDQHGQRVSLARLGPAALTFAFGHCTTVCPASVMHLERARRRARLDDLPIVVITVDPWRDTPDRLPTLAQHFELATNDRVLSGSVDEVSRVLSALGVAIRRNESNGDVEHVASAILVDARGLMTWRVDGPPAQLVSLLSRSR